MKRLTWIFWGALALAAAANPAVSADIKSSYSRGDIDCNNPGLGDSSTCSGSNLVIADQSLNSAYKWLIVNLSPAEMVKLKADQNAWIKERNNVCKLSAGDTSGDNWLSRLVADQTKAQCVMRYSKARTVELNNMIEKQGALSTISKNAPQDYTYFSDMSHEHGLWYMEVLVNAAEISRSAPVNVNTACKPSNPAEYLPSVGFNTTYRPMVNVNGENLIGLAVDLDKGKIYSSMNGVWQYGSPGSSGGLDIALGRPWKCGVQSNQLMQALIRRKYIEVNFGDKPFFYAMPSGYKPYKGEPLWLTNNATVNAQGGHDAVDYTSINLKSDKPLVTYKQEYADWKSMGSGALKYKGVQIRLEVDCQAMSARDAGSYYVTDKDTYVATASAPFHPQGDSARPMFKTSCFLQQNNLNIPDISLTGDWEPMLSPSPDFKIFEAIDNRQFNNGYLIVKQKNEFLNERAVDGEKSKTVLGITAFNCRDKTAHQIIGVPYGERGNIIDASYYDDANNYPRLPENRKRFEDICKAYGVP